MIVLMFNTYSRIYIYNSANFDLNYMSAKQTELDGT